jgi:hypothetical protein
MIKRMLAAFILAVSLLVFTSSPASATTIGPTSLTTTYGYIIGWNIYEHPGWQQNVYDQNKGDVNASVNVLVFQSDCNLVQYDYWNSTNGLILKYVAWASGTNTRIGTDCSLAFQLDGNIVIYYGGAAHWASGTNRNLGNSYQFVFQNNDAKIIYEFENTSWVCLESWDFTLRHNCG